MMSFAILFKRRVGIGVTHFLFKESSHFLCLSGEVSIFTSACVSHMYCICGGYSVDYMGPYVDL